MKTVKLLPALMILLAFTGSCRKGIDHSKDTRANYVIYDNARYLLGNSLLTVDTLGDFYRDSLYRFHFLMCSKDLQIDYDSKGIKGLLGKGDYVFFYVLSRHYPASSGYYKAALSPQEGELQGAEFTKGYDSDQGSFEQKVPYNDAGVVIIEEAGPAPGAYKMTFNMPAYSGSFSGTFNLLKRF